MRIPLSWLQEYLGSSLTIEVLDTAVTGLGIELDQVEETEFSFQNVVVGVIKKISNHPTHKEKYQVLEVDVGSRVIHIVTSAKNCVVGMVIPVAVKGSFVNGAEIVDVDVSGVLSEGMALSEKELDLGDDTSGILVLPKTFKVGEQLATLLSDRILHLSITPNLGHCLSVLGLARELATKLSIPLLKNWDHVPKNIGKMIELSQKMGCTFSDEQYWEVDLVSDGMCPRYSLLSLSHVVIEKSPFLWRRKLILSGFRPINIIVDALNLVMVEVGQPMHAFDYKAFLGKNKVVVGETQSLSSSYKMLDGQVRDIPEKTLVISNGVEQILAVAGVMGGFESSVQNRTNSVVIESAYFMPSAVRRSKTLVDVSSESSRRFERGVDPDGYIRALYLFLELLYSQQPGFIVHAAVSEEVEEESDPKKIILRVSRTEQLLGFHVSQRDIEDLFERQGYSYSWIDKDRIELSIPSYRHDLIGEVDLIEDIAKMIGYEHLERSSSPKCHLTTMPSHSRFDYEKKARASLISLGLQECVTSSLVSPRHVECIEDRPIPKQAIISVQNPMSQDQSILRPSLLPGLLDVLQRNVAFQQHSLPLFELGTVFLRVNEKIEERLAGAVLLYGQRDPQSALRDEKSFDFYDLKGLWENFREKMGFSDVDVVSAQISLYHPGRQAVLVQKGQEVGRMGELHPEMMKKYDIDRPIYFMEIDLQDLMPNRSDMIVQVKPLKLYPAMERDWTVKVPATLAYRKLLSSLQRASSEIVEKIDLISLYRSDKIGPDFQNITVAITFRHLERTLEQLEVDLQFQKMIEQVTHELSL